MKRWQIGYRLPSNRFIITPKGVRRYFMDDRTPSDRIHHAIPYDKSMRDLKWKIGMAPDAMQEIVHNLLHTPAFDPQRCEFCAADYGNRRPDGVFITLGANQITSINDAVLFIQMMEDMFQHPQDIHITNLNIAKEVKE